MFCKAATELHTIWFVAPRSWKNPQAASSTHKFSKNSARICTTYASEFILAGKRVGPMFLVALTAQKEGGSDVCCRTDGAERGWVRCFLSHWRRTIPQGQHRVTLPRVSICDHLPTTTRYLQYLRGCLSKIVPHQVTNGSTSPLHTASQNQLHNRTFEARSASWSFAHL
jgi:hypothetical protein